MKNSANGAVKGPTVAGGTECKTGYTKISLPSSTELETLNKVMPYVKFAENGIGGKPTVQFSGVNVQILSGAGSTGSMNGAGNLVLGYDENPGNLAQTGSHDLVLGEKQEFTSFSDVIVGVGNSVTAPGVFIAGAGNFASGEVSSVTGGIGGHATGTYATVLGGDHNTASGEGATASGGDFNLASGRDSSTTGGQQGEAAALVAWLGGGSKNKARASFSSIFGGKNLETTTEYQAIP